MSIIRQPKSHAKLKLQLQNVADVPGQTTATLCFTISVWFSWRTSYVVRISTFIGEDYFKAGFLNILKAKNVDQWWKWEWNLRLQRSLVDIFHCMDIGNIRNSLNCFFLFTACLKCVFEYKNWSSITGLVLGCLYYFCICKIDSEHCNLNQPKFIFTALK